MSTAEEWDFTVPDDAELLAELRRHGVRPGLRLHVELSGRRDNAHDTLHPDELPAFFGSFHSGQPDLAERSSEILRSEFPDGL